MFDDSVGKLKQLRADVAATLRDETPAVEHRPGGWWQFMHFWGLVGRFFWRNRCQVRASALAYTTLLALVPLLAVSVSIVLVLFRDSNAEEQLHRWIERAITGAAPLLGLADTGGENSRQQVVGNLLSYIGNIRFGTIGITAMAGLIFVAVSLLRTIEAVFNDIWGAERGRGWWDSIILYWAAITLGPVVLVVATTSGYLNALAEGSSRLQSLPGIEIIQAEALPLMIVAGAFGTLYRFMPNTRVQWSAALVGGAVASALWWANNRLGVLYNTKVVTYSKIYGSLGVVPLFLIGLYFSWLIVLFGSQVAYVFQNRHAYLQERLAERVHPQAREFAALRLMTEIGRHHLAGRPAPAAGDLATRLAIPARLAGQLLASLHAAGLVLETAGTQTGYTPARPLGQITVHDVLHALRTARGEDLATASDDLRPVVRSEYEGILALAEARSRQVTLEALLHRPPAGPG